MRSSNGRAPCARASSSAASEPGVDGRYTVREERETPACLGVVEAHARALAERDASSNAFAALFSSPAAASAAPVMVR